MMPDVLLQVNRPPVAPEAGLVVAMNLISVGLLLGLLVIFVGTWRKTRAPFSLGLVLFAAVLLLQDLARVGVALRVVTRAGAEVIPEALELVALVVLLYLATR